MFMFVLLNLCQALYLFITCAKEVIVVSAIISWFVNRLQEKLLADCNKTACMVPPSVFSFCGGDPGRSGAWVQLMDSAPLQTFVESEFFGVMNCCGVLMYFETFFSHSLALPRD